MDETKQPGLTFGQVALAAVEFRHREDFLAFAPTNRAASMTINVEVRTTLYNDGAAAGVSLKVFTDPEEKEAPYHFSIEMVAVIESVPSQENLPPDEYVKTLGATTLYPFLREFLANLTMRGRFGPVWLNPLNIQALRPTSDTTE